MHIPKTAGTSIRKLIETHYPESRIAWHYPPVYLAREPREVDVLAGHVCFGHHERLRLEQARYFTFIRDPMKRAISQVHYARRYHPQNLPELAERGARHAISSRRLWFYDNVMVRMFAGIRDQVPWGELDESAIDIALDNATRHFVFIGEQEYFARDLRALARVLGWRLDGPPPRQKVGRYGGCTLTADDLDFLKEINRLDLILWARLRAQIPARRWDGAVSTLLRWRRGAARRLKRWATVG